MPTIDEALTLAVNQHRAGHLAEAERIYREVLAVQPNNPQAWYLLGVIANQIGRPEVAVSCLEQALRVQPEFAEAHCDLATALGGLGQATAAIEHYQTATRLKPGYAEAHFNLANVLQREGRIEEAIAAYRRAIELKPDFTDGYHNLGLVLYEQGQSREAIACLRRVVELDPQSAEPHYRLATWLKEQSDFAGALVEYRRALELKPKYVEACTDLGVALHEQGHLDEALECQRQALAWNPDSWETHNNLGAIYQDQDRLEEALRHFERALELKPGLPETLVNVAIIHKWLGQLEQAWSAYQRALDARPDYAVAHVGIAKLRLIRGDFDSGFRQFEWRWKTGQLPPRDFSQPMWEGQPLHTGVTILLHCEQGFGDAIQFVRFAEIVKNSHPEAKVVLECAKSLLPLFGTLRGVDQLVARGDSLPAFDVHAPLLSLPRILGTRVETIPRNVPYLVADDGLVEIWRESLQTIEGFRIGINWHGREGHSLSQRRDLPLDQLASLAQIPNVRLISLQKGAAQTELASHCILHLGDDVDTRHGSFMDTAAVIKNADLVITSDTSIAHLAGALGVRVWVALPFAPDWRWLLDRSKSPWYPTMRLFRQKSPGDWQGVMREITVALAIAVS